MSEYQVLARKYRPKNFGELLGQDHVAKALSNAIDTGRLHHAYLFTGTRGVGKTTIARILAKCLNCETGITSQPCGECATCQSIDRGQFIDLIEIDAASRTKVEDTRELLENVPYAPVQGRYKVYLIDEVHMLSTHSFNALLKTLEEPPEHAKFIFATTDPQKLPITIISRCLQFVLRPMSQASLSEHLQKILTLENVPFAASAVWQLAAAAKGSVRDSLSLTDQAIAFGGGQIGDETVNQMLGLLDGLDVVGLLTAILHDQRTAVAAYIEQLRLQMVDVLAVFDRLIDAVYQSALMQTLPDLPTDMNAEQRASLLAFAEQISGDVLQLYYEILIKGRESVRLANTPMQALEMSILRLLAFRPLMQNEIAVPDEQTKLAPSHQYDTADNAPNSAQVTPITIDHTVDGADNTNTADNTDIIQIDAVVQSDASQLSSLPPMADEMVDEQMADDLQATQNHMALSVNQPINQVNSQTDSHNTQSDSQTSEQVDSQSDNQPNEQTQTDTALTDELLPSMVVLADDDLHADKQIKSHHTDDIDAMGIETMGDDEPLDAIHSQNTDKQIIDNNANTVADSRADDLIDNQADYQTDYHADSLADDADKTADNTIDNEQNQPNINPADTHQVALPSADLSAPATFNRTQMLAKLQPPATDTTEWTPASWDYWLYQARQKQVFDADELALLDNALMTGDFANSQLMVSEQNSQIEMSFAGVLHKISHHFREIQLADQLTIGDIHNKTPRFFREGRMEQVRIDAQNQLIQSPVFGKLWELGFIIDDDQPVLLSSKLTID